MKDLEKLNHKLEKTLIAIKEKTQGKVYIITPFPSESDGCDDDYISEVDKEIDFVYAAENTRLALVNVDFFEIVCNAKEDEDY